VTIHPIRVYPRPIFSIFFQIGQRTRHELTGFCSSCLESNLRKNAGKIAQLTGRTARQGSAIRRPFFSLSFAKFTVVVETAAVYSQ
jgi:hypothetical protein